MARWGPFNMKRKNQKIDAKVAALIKRDLAKPTDLPRLKYYEELALRYNCTGAIIRNIVSGQSWSSIDPAPEEDENSIPIEEKKDG